MKIIQAPHSLSTILRGEKTIFLAGSIEMGTAKNWQHTVISHLAHTKWNILNPRRDDWDSNWKQEFNDPQFYQQVNWELNALDRSSLILMNFLPNTKSPISLLELGLYASSNKMMVVCPKEFWRRGNVEVVCEKYDIQLFETLDEALTEIIDL